MCGECGNIKPIAEFAVAHNYLKCKTCARKHITPWSPHKRKIAKRHQCKHGCGTAVKERDAACVACYKAERRRLAVHTVRPHKKKAKPVIVTQFPCIDGCGAMISETNARCSDCKDRLKLVNKSEAAIRNKRAIEALIAGKTPGLMIWLDGEAALLTNKCSACHKPIALPGRCYQCATGRSRTFHILSRVLLDASKLTA